MSMQVAASLMIHEYESGNETPGIIGDYIMTDFAVTNDDSFIATSRIESPLEGTLHFLDINDNPLIMAHSSAEKNQSWWEYGEPNKVDGYDIYTTHIPWVKIKLPDNTRAFSFNVGADLVVRDGDNAWLTAIESHGAGIDSHYWFNVDENDTPGFGIFADKGSCSSITSVTIDPWLLWGFGNFSINQDSCSAQVPEPSVIALFGMGLLGVGFARRKVSS